MLNVEHAPISAGADSGLDPPGEQPSTAEDYSDSSANPQQAGWAGHCRLGAANRLPDHVPAAVTRSVLLIYSSRDPARIFAADLLSGRDPCSGHRSGPVAQW
jgi:hypothetical protein